MIKEKVGRNDECHCGSGKKYKKCCLEKDSNNTDSLPPLNPMIMEKEMSKLSKALENQNFGSEADAKKFITSFMESQQFDIDTKKSKTKLEEAQELIFDAWESPNPKEKIKLAKKAISLSEDCTDAYNILAENAKYYDQSKIFYEKGVESGKRVLGETFFKENKGHFWGLNSTRPYMRSKQGLAESLWHIGKKKEAVKHYQEMIELNNHDNQGIRYFLINYLIKTKQLDEAYNLLELFNEDCSANWLYSKALLSFIKLGDSKESQKLLKEAIKFNPFIPNYLIGNKKMPKHRPGYYGFGDDSEAIIYCSEAFSVWESNPTALLWLKKLS